MPDNLEIGSGNTRFYPPGGSGPAAPVGFSQQFGPTDIAPGGPFITTLLLMNPFPVKAGDSFWVHWSGFIEAPTPAADQVFLLDFEVLQPGALGWDGITGWNAPTGAGGSQTLWIPFAGVVTATADGDMQLRLAFENTTDSHGQSSEVTAMVAVPITRLF